MPAVSVKQYKFVMAMRDKYKSVNKAPENMKWVFGKEWDKYPEQVQNMRYERIYID